MNQATTHCDGAGSMELLASRREQRDQRNDTLFRYAVTGCALFVLIALLGAALSMLWGGREAFGRFGWRFLWSSDWDAVQKNFGALVPIYGTLGHGADRHAHRRARQFRHRAVSDRDRARLDAHAGIGGHRAARGHPLDHLRHVGIVRLRAVHGRQDRSLAR